MSCVGRPIRTIKLHINGFVGRVFVESSCKARNVRAQPCLHLAIVEAGEYFRRLMEAKSMGKKTLHKILLRVR